MHPPSCSYEQGLGGMNQCWGRGWQGGTGRSTAGLSSVAERVRVEGVMMGLRMYSFIDVMTDGWSYVPSVAPCGAAFNPS